MFNFNVKNYLDKIVQTPKEYYQGLVQATINDQWINTTQLFTIKEQSALPFVDEYTEYEAWVDVISDNLINTSKVYSDFVKVLFKDIDHKQNYKGQYYKINLDGEHEEYYICYDKMNRLSQVSDFNCVRCNNVLTWVDEYGKILTMPCYLGTDISSTNNLVSKDGIVPNTRLIILVQANEYTMSIVKNQRFMFQHSTAFKVEEVNNYMQEQETDGQVTCVKIYVDYSAILPSDNKELNICDYYKTNYTLTIDQNDIEQTNGFSGQLTATVKDGNDIVDMPLKWSTSDSEVVEIDEQGNYQVIGEIGSMGQITCSMADNESIHDTITIKVVDDYLPEKKIIINPNNITELNQGQVIDFTCGVYIEGEKQDDIVTCIPSGADVYSYTLAETLDGYKLTVRQESDNDLVLTFSADGCDDVIMTIELLGLL